ncbi:MAG: cysteine desulfurase NifS [Candidatus Pacearchaeota archaeon]|nr:cysteine desulfurase NifS [Candidatus Pacearchaeota archaeon]
MRKVYLDHAATTPLAKEVLEAMEPFFSEKFGNASSLHFFGREARDAIEKARNEIAKFINAKPAEIIFTSGGTESDNLALKGVAFASKDKGNHIITTKIEHPAILETCKWLEKQGFKITYLPVTKEGLVEPESVEKAITKDTILVSVMHANNEIGTIQPIEEIAKICKKHKVLFHTDAVQTFGKLDIDVKKMNVDLLSASAHKIYGPKGVGLLYVSKDVKIEALQHGGGHEQNIRSGTENVAGIVGFAAAVKLMQKLGKKEQERERKLRDLLISKILEIKDSRLNGSKEKRLPNNVNVSFKGVEGEALLLRLDQEGFAVSTGSACSSRSLEPSHVLIAIGLKPEEAHGSLRITLGKDTTEQDIEKFLNVLPKIVASLRKISPF